MALNRELYAIKTCVSMEIEAQVQRFVNQRCTSRDGQRRTFPITTITSANLKKEQKPEIKDTGNLLRSQALLESLNFDLPNLNRYSDL